MSYAISYDGVKLYYKSVGKGEPLLLLAGQACDHREWDRVAHDLGNHFEVIAWDYRGTGKSDKPISLPYSTRGFASDAAAILDTCGHPRAHVYGFSMGGRVAQWLAIDHGHRIGALVLGATSPGNMHGVARKPSVDKALSSGDMGALLLTSFTPSWIEANDALSKEISTLWNRPLRPDVRQLHYQASHQHDAWKFLPMISAPTLVLHGSEDELNPVANGVLLADNIPGARLTLLKGARHYYFEEFRAESAQLVADFCQTHAIYR